MEVGAEGFARRLPRLRRRILRAAFVALDMEFTGLHSTSLQNNEPSLFDSPAERYVTARQSVQRFTLVQLGKCCSDMESEFPRSYRAGNILKREFKYVVHSYNFFLFPSTLGIRDVEFTLSASSIQFLSHYGFDYNKFLKDGIPYMNEVQEKILRQHLLAGTWKVCSASNADKDVLKKVIDEVTSWIAAAKEEDTMILQDLNEYAIGGVETVLCFLSSLSARYDNDILIESGNGYHMLEVQLVLRQALENVWTEPLGDKKVMVKKVSPGHRQLLENSSYDHCQKKLILLSAWGFTNLFQILVKAKKPLVGHNMLMDLMHLHDKFYRPLPESYEEFKRNIHNLFPVIIDTKTVIKSVQKKCLFPRVSSLLEAYAASCSNLNLKGPPCPVIALASGCSRYAEKKSPHEAGYDAFLCGSVLLMSVHLLVCRSADDAVEADPSFSQYLTVLAEHVNKVNFIRGGVSSINFSGEDAPCHHPPALIVHVRGWSGLTERQIYQEFKSHCRFDVRRLSENQFILLSNQYKHVRLVLRNYRHHPHLQVSVYRRWRHSPSVNEALAEQQPATHLQCPSASPSGEQGSQKQNLWYCGTVVSLGLCTWKNF